MQNEHAQICIKIPTSEKDLFNDICREMDTTPSREIRVMIRAYIFNNRSQLPKLPKVEES